MIKQKHSQSTHQRPPGDTWSFFDLSWLFPLRCQFCLAPGHDRMDLCRGCHQDLPWLACACVRCAEPLFDDHNDLTCGHCLTDPPAFAQSYIPLRYEFPVNRLIAELKYQRRIPPARLMGDLLARHLSRQANLTRPQAIVPVPLHPQRLRERGFNQAAEIARYLGSRLRLPVVNDLAQRTRYTPPQQTLSAKARQDNLRGAFEISTPARYRHIALVDDVMTTGSTLRALAEACRQAGIESIQCWCVARTP